MGAKHFKMKRMENVATEMALHVLAYNMTRVMTILRRARAGQRNEGMSKGWSLAPGTAHRAVKNASGRHHSGKLSAGRQKLCPLREVVVRRSNGAFSHSLKVKRT